LRSDEQILVRVRLTSQKAFTAHSHCPCDRAVIGFSRRFAAVEFGFEGRVWEWRGPPPYHFVSVPPEHADDVSELAPGITYGWGMVPVEVRLGGTSWRTALFPKDGGYVVPLRDSVRRREKVELGDLVRIQLMVGPP